MGDSAKRQARGSFERRLELAVAALLWERVWPALWPAVAVIGVFLALALFDLPARLPNSLHWALLLLTAALLSAALVDAARRLRWPDRLSARRRLETASGLAHRPLSALDDTQATGANDPSAAALWRAHQARMAGAARRLRIGVPAAGLVRRDPYALRVALSLVLLLGAIDAGNDWPERVARALNPGALPFGTVAPVSLDIWLTPPDYTGLPPVFLPAAAPAKPIAVPVGSTVLAQVHGGGTPPRLTIDKRTTDFSAIDDQNFKGAATIAAGTRLTITQAGRRLGSWPIRIVPDTPPRIEFAKPPAATALKALQLDYKASDDYGVEDVKAIIHRAGGQKGPALTLNLPLPGLHQKDVQGTSYRDLTASLWAGMPVTIELQATDALGQTGTSKTVQTVLPERVFRNPVAKAIVEERKQLALHPQEKDLVAEILSDLSLQTQLYHNDIVVFLALRTAQARLLLDQDGSSITPVESLLWQTALRIENGQVPHNQQDLRNAFRALQNALAHNAPDSEIERLMRRIQKAMNQYFESLARQMARQSPNALKTVDPAHMLSTQDLQHMLDTARQMAETGARDRARQLLAQLQQMLENLHLVRPMTGQNGQSQMMSQMQDMLREQQHLLDRSFTQSRQGQLGPNMTNEAQEQDALRRMLDQLIRRLQRSGQNAPQGMGRADRAMRGAAQALRRNQPDQAIGPQTEALEALHQAARGLGTRMMGNNYGSGPSAMPGEEPGLYQAQRDPFGRLLDTEQGNGRYDGGGQLRMGKSLNDDALEKARQILKELRRRAGERARPAIERDYIDRLLKEF